VSGQHVISILWPPGYSARFDQPRLVGPGGEVVAHAGDVIEASGGFKDVALERCQVSERVASLGLIQVESKADG
jgi:hypothetical protein